MKKLIKSFVAICVVTTITIPSIVTHHLACANPQTSLPLSKQEVVFANLGCDGSSEGVYVVNYLNAKDTGDYTDHGDFDSIKNLSDANEIIYTKQEQTAHLNISDTSTPYTYQANLSSTQLPWNFEIAYILDGNPITADKLAGSTGKLEVVIKTSVNPEIDSSFYENYMLQISASLNSEIASEVVSEKAQIAIAGSDTLINFTAMPNKEYEFKFSAKVHNFEMPGIEISAIPLSMAIENPDTSALNSGMTQLADGNNEVTNGINQAANGILELQKGSQALSEGLDTMQKSLYQESENAFSKIEDPTQASEKYMAASANFNAAFAIAFNAAEPDKVGQEMAMQIASQATATQAQELQTALEALVTINANNAGYMGTSQSLSMTADSLGTSDNSESLIGGSSTLYNGFNPLYSGLTGLASGSNEITKEIQKLPSSIQSEIDTILSSYDKNDFTPISFTSVSNKSCDLVQFVIHTNKIEIAPDPEPETQEEDKGIWGRLLALFGL